MKRILSNSEAALTAQKSQLATIRKHIKDADTHEAGHRKSLNAALAKIYGLTVSLLKDDRLRVFVESEGSTWGAVQAKNPFQPVVAIAFNKSASASSGSKYSKVLLLAQSTGISAADFPKWLEQEGGVADAYARALTVSSPSLEQQFEETEEERLEQALAALKERRLGSPVPLKETPDLSDAPSSIAAYRNALVRIVDGNAELVQVLPGRKDDVIRSLLSTLQVEAPYVRRKLVDKPFYELFRVCDLLVRLNPKVEEEKGDEMDNLALTADGQVDLDALGQRAKAKAAKSKVASLDRYRDASGLVLVHSKAGWKASAVSTRPVFASVESLIASHLDPLKADQTYFLSLHQAKRIVDTFRLHENWAVRARKRLPAGGFDAPDDGEIVLDQLNETVAWRKESAQAQAAEFACEKAAWSSTLSWQATLKSAGQGSRFPKQLALKVDGDQLWLRFPEDAKARKVDPSRRLLMGTFVRAGAKIDLRERWILRSDLLALAQIARDYGAAFRGALFKGSEGISGVEFSTPTLRLSFPLAISLAGDRASTTIPY